MVSRKFSFQRSLFKMGKHLCVFLLLTHDGYAANAEEMCYGITVRIAYQIKALADEGYTGDEILKKMTVSEEKNDKTTRTALVLTKVVNKLSKTMLNKASNSFFWDPDKEAMKFIPRCMDELSEVKEELAEAASEDRKTLKQKPASSQQVTQSAKVENLSPKPDEKNKDDIAKMPKTHANESTKEVQKESSPSLSCGNPSFVELVICQEDAFMKLDKQAFNVFRRKLILTKPDASEAMIKSSYTQWREKEFSSCKESTCIRNKFDAVLSMEGFTTP